MYFSSPDIKPRIEIQECNQEPKIQSTQREQKKYKISRREVQSIKADTLHRRRISMGMKPDRVAKTFIKVIATQIKASIQ